MTDPDTLQQTKALNQFFVDTRAALRSSIPEIDRWSNETLFDTLYHSDPDFLRDQGFQLDDYRPGVSSGAGLVEKIRKDSGLDNRRPNEVAALVRKQLPTLAEVWGLNEPDFDAEKSRTLADRIAMVFPYWVGPVPSENSKLSDELTKALDDAEKHDGDEGFWHSFLFGGGWEGWTPFYSDVNEAVNAHKLLKLAEKAEKDPNSLTEDEAIRFNLLLADAMAEGNKSWLAKAGDAARVSTMFMVEWGITSFIAGLLTTVAPPAGAGVLGAKGAQTAEKAAAKGAAAAAKKIAVGVGEKAANKFAARTPGALAKVLNSRGLGMFEKALAPGGMAYGHPALAGRAFFDAARTTAKDWASKLVYGSAFNPATGVVEKTAQTFAKRAAVRGLQTVAADLPIAAYVTGATWLPKYGLSQALGGEGATRMEAERKVGEYLSGQKSAQQVLEDRGIGRDLGAAMVENFSETLGEDIFGPVLGAMYDKMRGTKLGLKWGLTKHEFAKYFSDAARRVEAAGANPASVDRLRRMAGRMALFAEKHAGLAQTTGDLLDVIHYNGLLVEHLEERAADFMYGLFGMEGADRSGGLVPALKNTVAIYRPDDRGTMDDLKIEALTLGMPLGTHVVQTLARSGFQNIYAPAANQLLGRLMRRSHRPGSTVISPELAGISSSLSGTSTDQEENRAATAKLRNDMDVKRMPTGPDQELNKRVHDAGEQARRDFDAMIEERSKGADATLFNLDGVDHPVTRTSPEVVKARGAVIFAAEEAERQKAKEARDAAKLKMDNENAEARQVLEEARDARDAQSEDGGARIQTLRAAAAEELTLEAQTKTDESSRELLLARAESVLLGREDEQLLARAEELKAEWDEKTPEEKAAITSGHKIYLDAKEADAIKGLLAYYTKALYNQSKSQGRLMDILNLAVSWATGLVWVNSENATRTPGRAGFEEAADLAMRRYATAGFLNATHSLFRYYLDTKYEREFAADTYNFSGPVWAASAAVNDDVRRRSLKDQTQAKVEILSDLLDTKAGGAAANTVGVRLRESYTEEDAGMDLKAVVDEIYRSPETYGFTRQAIPLKLAPAEEDGRQFGVEPGQSLLNMTADQKKQFPKAAAFAEGLEDQAAMDVANTVYRAMVVPYLNMVSVIGELTPDDISLLQVDGLSQEELAKRAHKTAEELDEMLTSGKLDRYLMRDPDTGLIMLKDVSLAMNSSMEDAEIAFRRELLRRMNLTTSQRNVVEAQKAWATLLGKQFDYTYKFKENGDVAEDGVVRKVNELPEGEQGRARRTMFANGYTDDMVEVVGRIRTTLGNIRRARTNAANEGRAEEAAAWAEAAKEVEERLQSALYLVATSDFVGMGEYVSADDVKRLLASSQDQLVPGPGDSASLRMMKALFRASRADIDITDYDILTLARSMNIDVTTGVGRAVFAQRARAFSSMMADAMSERKLRVGSTVWYVNDKDERHQAVIRSTKYSEDGTLEFVEGELLDETGLPYPRNKATTFQLDTPDAISRRIHAESRLEKVRLSRNAQIIEGTNQELQNAGFAALSEAALQFPSVAVLDSEGRIDKVRSKYRLRVGATTSPDGRSLTVGILYQEGAAEDFIESIIKRATSMPKVSPISTHRGTDHSLYLPAPIRDALERRLAEIENKEPKSRTRNEQAVLDLLMPHKDERGVISDAEYRRAARARFEMVGKVWMLSYGGYQALPGIDGIEYMREARTLALEEKNATNNSATEATPEYSYLADTINRVLYGLTSVGAVEEGRSVGKYPVDRELEHMKYHAFGEPLNVPGAVSKSDYQDEDDWLEDAYLTRVEMAKAAMQRLEEQREALVKLVGDGTQSGEDAGALGELDAKISQIRNRLASLTRTETPSSESPEEPPTTSARVLQREVPRVTEAVNRVFNVDIIKKDNWFLPANNEAHVYRLTGAPQIKDMQDVGYVRPKEGKIKGGRRGEVHWGRGAKQHGYNKGNYFVIEAKAEGLDDRVGALSLDDLEHVWSLSGEAPVDVLPDLKRRYQESLGNEAPTTSVKVITTSGRGQLSEDEQKALENIQMDDVVAIDFEVFYDDSSKNPLGKDGRYVGTAKEAESVPYLVSLRWKENNVPKTWVGAPWDFKDWDKLSGKVFVAHNAGYDRAFWERIKNDPVYKGALANCKPSRWLCTYLMFENNRPANMKGLNVIDVFKWTLWRAKQLGLRGLRVPWGTLSKDVRNAAVGKGLNNGEADVPHITDADVTDGVTALKGVDVSTWPEYVGGKVNEAGDRTGGFTRDEWQQMLLYGYKDALMCWDILEVMLADAADYRKKNDGKLDRHVLSAVSQVQMDDAIKSLAVDPTTDPATAANFTVDVKATPTQQEPEPLPEGASPIPEPVIRSAVEGAKNQAEITRLQKQLKSLEAMREVFVAQLERINKEMGDLRNKIVQYEQFAEELHNAQNAHSAENPAAAKAQESDENKNQTPGKGEGSPQVQDVTPVDIGKDEGTAEAAEDNVTPQVPAAQVETQGEAAKSMTGYVEAPTVIDSDGFPNMADLLGDSQTSTDGAQVPTTSASVVTQGAMTLAEMDDQLLKDWMVAVKSADTNAYKKIIQDLTHDAKWERTRKWFRVALGEDSSEAAQLVAVVQLFTWQLARHNMQPGSAAKDSFTLQQGYLQEFFRLLVDPTDPSTLSDSERRRRDIMKMYVPLQIAVGLFNPVERAGFRMATRPVHRFSSAAMAVLFAFDEDFRRQFTESSGLESEYEDVFFEDDLAAELPGGPADSNESRMARKLAETGTLTKDLMAAMLDKAGGPSFRSLLQSMVDEDMADEVPNEYRFGLGTFRLSNPKINPTAVKARIHKEHPELNEKQVSDRADEEISAFYEKHSPVYTREQWEKTRERMANAIRWNEGKIERSEGEKGILDLMYGMSFDMACVLLPAWFSREYTPVMSDVVRVMPGAAEDTDRDLGADGTEDFHVEGTAHRSGSAAGGTGGGIVSMIEARLLRAVEDVRQKIDAMPVVERRRITSETALNEALSNGETLSQDEGSGIFSAVDTRADALKVIEDGGILIASGLAPHDVARMALADSLLDILKNEWGVGLDTENKSSLAGMLSIDNTNFVANLRDAFTPLHQTLGVIADKLDAVRAGADADIDDVIRFIATNLKVEGGPNIFGDDPDARAAFIQAAEGIFRSGVGGGRVGRSLKDGMDTLAFLVFLCGGKDAIRRMFRAIFEGGQAMRGASGGEATFERLFVESENLDQTAAEWTNTYIQKLQYGLEAPVVGEEPAGEHVAKYSDFLRVYDTIVSHVYGVRLPGLDGAEHPIWVNGAVTSPFASLTAKQINAARHCSAELQQALASAAEGTPLRLSAARLSGLLYERDTKLASGGNAAVTGVNALISGVYNLAIRQGYAQKVDDQEDERSAGVGVLLQQAKEDAGETNDPKLVANLWLDKMAIALRDAASKDTNMYVDGVGMTGKNRLLRGGVLYRQQLIPTQIRQSEGSTVSTSTFPSAYQVVLKPSLAAMGVLHEELPFCLWQLTGDIYSEAASKDAYTQDLLQRTVAGTQIRNGSPYISLMLPFSDKEKQMPSANIRREAVVGHMARHGSPLQKLFAAMDVVRATPGKTDRARFTSAIRALSTAVRELFPVDAAPSEVGEFLLNMEAFVENPTRQWEDKEKEAAFTKKMGDLFFQIKSGQFASAVDTLLGDLVGMDTPMVLRSSFSEDPLGGDARIDNARSVRYTEALVRRPTRDGAPGALAVRATTSKSSVQDERPLNTYATLCFLASGNSILEHGMFGPGTMFGEETWEKVSLHPVELYKRARLLTTEYVPAAITREFDPATGRPGIGVSTYVLVLDKTKRDGDHVTAGLAVEILDDNGNVVEEHQVTRNSDGSQIASSEWARRMRGTSLEGQIDGYRGTKNVTFSSDLVLKGNTVAATGFKEASQVKFTVVTKDGREVEVSNDGLLSALDDIMLAIPSMTNKETGESYTGGTIVSETVDDGAAKVINGDADSGWVHDSFRSSPFTMADGRTARLKATGRLVRRFNTDMGRVANLQHDAREVSKKLFANYLFSWPHMTPAQRGIAAAMYGMTEAELGATFNGESGNALVEEARNVLFGKVAAAAVEDEQNKQGSEGALIAMGVPADSPFVRTPLWPSIGSRLAREVAPKMQVVALQLVGPRQLGDVGRDIMASLLIRDAEAMPTGSNGFKYSPAVIDANIANSRYSWRFLGSALDKDAAISALTTAFRVQQELANALSENRTDPRKAEDLGRIEDMKARLRSSIEALDNYFQDFYGQKPSSISRVHGVLGVPLADLFVTDETTETVPMADGSVRTRKKASFDDSAWSTTNDGQTTVLLGSIGIDHRMPTGYVGAATAVVRLGLPVTVTSRYVSALKDKVIIPGQENLAVLPHSLERAQGKDNDGDSDYVQLLTYDMQLASSSGNEVAGEAAARAARDVTSYFAVPKETPEAEKTGGSEEEEGEEEVYDLTPGDKYQLNVREGRRKASAAMKRMKIAAYRNISTDEAMLAIDKDTWLDAIPAGTAGATALRNMVKERKESRTWFGYMTPASYAMDRHAAIQAKASGGARAATVQALDAVSALILLWNDEGMKKSGAKVGLAQLMASEETQGPGTSDAYVKWDVLRKVFTTLANLAFDAVGDPILQTIQVSQSAVDLFTKFILQPSRLQGISNLSDRDAQIALISDWLVFIRRPEVAAYLSCLENKRPTSNYKLTRKERDDFYDAWDGELPYWSRIYVSRNVAKKDIHNVVGLGNSRTISEAAFARQMAKELVLHMWRGTPFREEKVRYEDSELFRGRKYVVLNQFDVAGPVARALLDGSYGNVGGRSADALREAVWNFVRGTDRSEFSKAAEAAGKAGPVEAHVNMASNPEKIKDTAIALAEKKLEACIARALSAMDDKKLQADITTMLADKAAGKADAQLEDSVMRRIEQAFSSITTTLNGALVPMYNRVADYAEKNEPVPDDLIADILAYQSVRSAHSKLVHQLHNFFVTQAVPDLVNVMNGAAGSLGQFATVMKGVNKANLSDPDTLCPRLSAFMQLRRTDLAPWFHSTLAQENAAYLRTFVRTMAEVYPSLQYLTLTDLFIHPDPYDLRVESDGTTTMPYELSSVRPPSGVGQKAISNMLRIRDADVLKWLILNAFAYPLGVKVEELNKNFDPSAPLVPRSIGDNKKKDRAARQQKALMDAFHKLKTVIYGGVDAETGRVIPRTALHMNEERLAEAKELLNKYTTESDTQTQLERLDMAVDNYVWRVYQVLSVLQSKWQTLPEYLKRLAPGAGALQSMFRVTAATGVDASEGSDTSLTYFTPEGADYEDAPVDGESAAGSGKFGANRSATGANVTHLGNAKFTAAFPGNVGDTWQMKAHFNAWIGAVKDQLAVAMAIANARTLIEKTAKEGKQVSAEDPDVVKAVADAFRGTPTDGFEENHVPLSDTEYTSIARALLQDTGLSVKGGALYEVSYIGDYSNGKYYMEPAHFEPSLALFMLTTAGAEAGASGHNLIQLFPPSFIRTIEAQRNLMRTPALAGSVGIEAAIPEAMRGAGYQDEVDRLNRAVAAIRGMSTQEVLDGETLAMTYRDDVVGSRIEQQRREANQKSREKAGPAERMVSELVHSGRSEVTTPNGLTLPVINVGVQTRGSQFVAADQGAVDAAKQDVLMAVASQVNWSQSPILNNWDQAVKRAERYGAAVVTAMPEKTKSSSADVVPVAIVVNPAESWPDRAGGLGRVISMETKRTDPKHDAGMRGYNRTALMAAAVSGAAAEADFMNDRRAPADRGLSGLASVESEAEAAVRSRMKKDGGVRRISGPSAIRAEMAAGRYNPSPGALAVLEGIEADTTEYNAERSRAFSEGVASALGRAMLTEEERKQMEAQVEARRQAKEQASQQPPAAPTTSASAIKTLDQMEAEVAAMRRSPSISSDKLYPGSGTVPVSSQSDDAVRLIALNVAGVQEHTMRSPLGARGLEVFTPYLTQAQSDRELAKYARMARRVAEALESGSFSALDTLDRGDLLNELTSMLGEKAAKDLATRIGLAVIDARELLSEAALQADDGVPPALEGIVPDSVVPAEPGSLANIVADLTVNPTTSVSTMAAMANERIAWELTLRGPTAVHEYLKDSSYFLVAETNMLNTFTDRCMHVWASDRSLRGVDKRDKDGNLRRNGIFGRLGALSTEGDRTIVRYTTAERNLLSLVLLSIGALANGEDRIFVKGRAPRRQPSTTYRAPRVASGLASGIGEDGMPVGGQSLTVEEVIEAFNKSSLKEKLISTGRTEQELDLYRAARTLADYMAGFRRRASDKTRRILAAEKVIGAAKAAIPISVSPDGFRGVEWADAAEEVSRQARKIGSVGVGEIENFSLKSELDPSHETERTPATLNQRKLILRLALELQSLYSTTTGDVTTVDPGMSALIDDLLAPVMFLSKSERGTLTEEDQRNWDRLAAAYGNNPRSGIRDANRVILQLAREIETARAIRAAEKGETYEISKAKADIIRTMMLLMKEYDMDESPAANIRPERFTTYKDAFEHGRFAATANPYLDLTRHVKSVLDIVFRRATLELMMRTPDHNGNLLLIANPDVSHPADDISEDTYRFQLDYITSRMRLGDTGPQGKIGVRLPSEGDPRKMLNHLISTGQIAALRNKNAYKQMASPYMSELGFFASTYGMMGKGRVRGEYGESTNAVRLLEHVIGRQPELYVNVGRRRFDLAKAALNLVRWTKHTAVGHSLFFMFAGLESVVAGTGLKRNILFRTIRHLFSRQNPWRQMSELSRAIKRGDPSYDQVMYELHRSGLCLSDSVITDMTSRDNARWVQNAKELGEAWGGKKWGQRLEVGATLLSGRIQSDWMMKDFFPALKTWGAIDLANEMSAKMPGVPRSEVYRVVAPIINAAYGGRNWHDLGWATPKAVYAMNLLLFAPQWTLAAWETAGGGLLTGHALGDYITPEQTKFVIRNWAAMYLFCLQLMPNLIQAAIYAMTRGAPPKDDDDQLEKDHWLAIMNERDRGGLFPSIDITPLMRSKFGKILRFGREFDGGETGSRRVYVQFGKQSYEVLNGWLDDPKDQLLRKTSQPVKLVWEQVFGYSPGSSDFALPFANSQGGFLGSILSSNKGFRGSRVSYIAQKFMPLTASQVLNGQWDSAGLLIGVAPIKRGMSRRKAMDAIKPLLDSYASPSRYQKFGGSAALSHRVAKLLSDYVRALEDNGYNAKDIVSQASKEVSAKYYKAFFDAVDAKDTKTMDAMARSLIRLGVTTANVLSRYSERVKSRTGKALTKEEKQAIAQAFDTRKPVYMKYERPKKHRYPRRIE